MTDHHAPARNVGILVYNDVELLDFCGPYEVFTTARKVGAEPPLRVFTVAVAPGPVVTANGLSIHPDFTIANCPAMDVLVVPGGQGARREKDNPDLLNWLKERDREVEILLSVCTGALILGTAGLLDGLRATTFHGALDLLAELSPSTEVVRDRRVVDNGRVVTSAGVSAGIDASLHVAGRLLGMDAAQQMADHMEYRWVRD